MKISEQIVENGYFVRRSRPNEGSRLVYLPKDQEDLEYAPQTFMLVGSKGDVPDHDDWFIKHDSNAGLVGGDAARLAARQIGADGAIGWHGIGDN